MVSVRPATERITGLVDRFEHRTTRPDGTPDRRCFVLALAIAYLFFCATYIPINAFSVGRRAHVLFLPGEAGIPFIPEFEFLYCLGYLLPVVAVVKVPDARRLAQLILAFLLTLAVAYGTYLVLPVYLERPQLVVDSPATILLSLEYLDPSYNHFPSLHVAITLLLYLASRDGMKTGSRRAMLLLVLGISISTLFIKQHYVADVVYGAALGIGTWAMAGRWSAHGSRVP